MVLEMLICCHDGGGVDGDGDLWWRWRRWFVAMMEVIIYRGDRSGGGSS